MFKLAHNGKILMDLSQTKPPSPTFIVEALQHSKFARCKIDNDSIETFFKGEQTELTLAVAVQIHATFNVIISEDKMQALGTLVTAHGGNPITLEAAKKALMQAGVTRGYKQAFLEKLLEQQKAAPPGTQISEPLALGKSPKNGDPSVLKVHVCTLKERLKQPKLREDGTVDMRDFGALASVSAGTILATQVPATSGKDGYNVVGDTLTAKPGDSFQLNPGEGTQISSSNPLELVSTIAGCPSETNNGMRVDDIFTINEVSVKSGHIDFNGSVVVSQNVCPGMKINAKGDVTVLGSVESAEITSGGNIEVKQAVIGHADHQHNDEGVTCHLVAKGDIEISHGQYAYLEGQNLLIHKQSNHCQLKAFDKITVGSGDKPAGKLLGGEVLDAQRVVAGEFGNASGVKMSIYLARSGMEMAAQNDECLKALSKVDSQIDKLQQAVEKAELVKDIKKKKLLMQKIAATQQHFCQQAETLEQQLSDLDHHLHDLLDNTQLTANQKLHSGVEIHIFDRVYKTNRQYPACSAKLIENEVKIDFDK